MSKTNDMNKTKTFLNENVDPQMELNHFIKQIEGGVYTEQTFIKQIEGAVYTEYKGPLIASGIMFLNCTMNILNKSECLKL